MFHVKHEGWSEATARIGVPLPEAALSLLNAYEQLLIERGGPMGIIAPGDIDRVRERHILDSLRAAVLVGPETKRAYDFGSGGGLPGIVLAIACPDIAISLVEVRKNRAAFLEDVVSELGVTNADVYPRRLEKLRERRDLCLARAFAPFPKAWRAAAPLLGSGGRLIYWAGASFDLTNDVPAGVATRSHPPTGLPDAGSLLESWAEDDA